jgi:uncharacterized protein YciI
MKPLTVFIIFIFIIASCNSKEHESKNKANDSITLKNSKEPVYDSVLAMKYGADKYGMKKYIFAYLKRGPNRNQDSATIDQIQKGHMANINRLADEGKLILAGPFFDDTEIRGIFVFDVETLAEAEALINTDPAIKSGRLIMELHPWYGSAALKAVTEIHRTISKENP